MGQNGLLYLNPGILEVAAIGVPNEKSGEIVKIFIVKKDAGLTEANVIEHCRTGIYGEYIDKDCHSISARSIFQASADAVLNGHTLPDEA